MLSLLAVLLFLYAVCASDIVSVGNDHVLVGRRDKQHGEAACARHNLLFAVLPDAATALRVLVRVLDHRVLDHMDTSTIKTLYVKGFRGQGAPDGGCVRIDVATRQLSFVLDAVACAEDGMVLCTDKLLKALLDNTTTTVSQTTTILRTTTVATTTSSRTVTVTTSITTQTTTTVEVKNPISFKLAATLPLETGLATIFSELKAA